MSVHCHKSVSVLMLPGCKTPTTNYSYNYLFNVYCVHYVYYYYYYVYYVYYY